MQSPQQIEMVHRSCPLCGSKIENEVFADADFDPDQFSEYAFASRKLPEYMHYRLICCPACDVLYANPLPTLETLARAYREASYDSGEEARYASLTYAGILDRILPSLPSRESALDIGAGDGAFLEQLILRDFSEVVGAEPSAAPIAAATEKIRPCIRQGLFRPGDYESDHFDLITCFQTVEHLYDPLQVAQDAFSLLKPGGAVLFICHNRRALSARLLRLRSPIFDIEHLQLFSPRSSRYLLEKAGFIGVKVSPVVNRYPIAYWLRLLPLGKKTKLRAISVAKTSRIGSLPVSLPAGNLAVIGYKR